MTREIKSSCSSCCEEHSDHDHNHNNNSDHDASCGCGIEHNKEDGGMKKTITLIVISLIALIVSFMNFEIFHYVDPAWIAVILCGYPIFKGAFLALKDEHKITSALLISVAIVASIALEITRLSGAFDMGDAHGHGYIFAAGEIAFLMGVGGLIEDWTVSKARSGIEKLVKLVPKTAYLKTDSGIKEVDIDELKIGDIVVIKPGDIICIDGNIIMGSTSVDQSSVTGESLPVDKLVGDLVYSGTQNKNGAIEVRMSKDPKDMTVNKLVALVEEAEGKKAPIARLADKWASYIVPAAIATSIVVFGISYFFFDISTIEAVIRGVTILVVFCPCSLSLSTPTAVAAGIGNGSGRGILIKSGAAIEELAKIKTIAFDKTGTLTEGNVRVTAIYAPGEDEDTFIGLMGAAESYTDHPIAKAVSKFAENRLRDETKNYGLDRILQIPTNTEAILGVGAKAMVGEYEVILCSYDKIPEALRNHVGNYDNYNEINNKIESIDVSMVGKAREYMSEGATVIGGIINGKLKGIIALADTIREGAGEAMEQLKSQGYNVIMLTGDNEKSAQFMANQAGKIEYRHSLMPENKLQIIEELKKSGKVCMVGDGINDTPALAIANASIAMGALGSDAAIETADVSLMTSDIRKVPQLLKLSKRVLGTIKINILISLIISVLAVILSTAGVLNPVTGAIVHNVSAVLVVLNSAMILKEKA